MSFELQATVWTSLILFALLLFQGALVPVVQGFGWGLGSRDAPRDATVLQGRAARTVANQMEGMMLFVPLVLVAHLAGISTGLTVWGAALYLGGRVLFAPLYLFGVPVLRSAAWGVSVTGIVLIAYELGMAII